MAGRFPAGFSQKMPFAAGHDRQRNGITGWALLGHDGIMA
jgi:hypothetical protein